jgi:hypothetical protein
VGDVILLTMIVITIVLMLTTIGGSESLGQPTHNERANVGRQVGFHRRLLVSKAGAEGNTSSPTPRQRLMAARSSDRGETHPQTMLLSRDSGIDASAASSR